MALGSPVFRSASPTKMVDRGVASALSSWYRFDEHGRELLVQVPRGAGCGVARRPADPPVTEATTWAAWRSKFSRRRA